MSLLTDKEIDDLTLEPKRLANEHLSKVIFKNKGAHKERGFEVSGDNGNRFRIIVRISTINSMAFSVILAWVSPLTGLPFRLRRYDGKSHSHSNKIERDSFFDFHVHYATERYQRLGLDEDFYAKADGRFVDYHSALTCLFGDCGFIYPTGSNLELFEREEI